MVQIQICNEPISCKHTYQLYTFVSQFPTSLQWSPCYTGKYWNHKNCCWCTTSMETWGLNLNKRNQAPSLKAKVFFWLISLGEEAELNVGRRSNYNMLGRLMIIRSGESKALSLVLAVFVIQSSKTRGRWPFFWTLME